MNTNKPQLGSVSKPGLILKLALLQLFGTIIFSLVLFYCFDTREALSAMLGGSIAALASVVAAGRLFTTRHDAQAAEILVRFYVSVAIKVIVTLAMMAVCIVYLKVSMLPFVIAYLLAAVVTNWLFLLIAAD